MKARRGKHILRRRESGAQLLEFALALPFLLVLIAGMVDFAQAWNVRQVLANAARDGARLGTNQARPGDLDNTSPASIQQICQQVGDYVQREHLDVEFMNNVTNSGSSNATVSGICSTPDTIPDPYCTGSTSCVPEAWTYYSSGTYGLKIERNVGVPPSGYTTCGPGTLVSCTSSTRVTLTYPYNWSFGFNRVVNLLGFSNYPSKISIQAFSTMANLAS